MSSSSSGRPGVGLGGGDRELLNELAQDPHEASRTASEPRDIFSLAISKSSKSNFFLGVWGVGVGVVEGEMGLEGEVEGAMAWKH